MQEVVRGSARRTVFVSSRRSRTEPIPSPWRSSRSQKEESLRNVQNQKKTAASNDNSKKAAIKKRVRKRRNMATFQPGTKILGRCENALVVG